MKLYLDYLVIMHNVGGYPALVPSPVVLGAIGSLDLATFHRLDP